MITHFQWPEVEDPPDAKVIADVRDHGVHVLNVSGDESGPGFAFSIGLFLNYSHPEILIFGLGLQRSATIINDLRERIAAGDSFAAGARDGEVLRELEVTFVDVPLAAYPEHLGYAMWFYASLPEPFPCLQLIWPDRSGNFPWNRGFDAAMIVHQPVLSILFRPVP